jgi:tRNA nucleotidyltransferase (CCA-adding enzyme)
MQSVLAVATDRISREALAEGRKGPEIGARIQKARLAALEEYLARA